MIQTYLKKGRQKKQKNLKQNKTKLPTKERNRLKVLGLIDSVPEELWTYGRRFMILYRGSDQDHYQEKEMQKGKMVV